MELSTGNWITIIVYLVSFSAAWGTLSQKLVNLEKKQDKHNNLIERMAKVESSTSSAHKRLDSLFDDDSCGDCRNFEKR